jgi:hypothetical protein
MVFMNDEDRRYTRPQEDIEAMRAENQPPRLQTATVKPAPIEANVGKRSGIGTVTGRVEIRRPRLPAERSRACRPLLPVQTDRVLSFLRFQPIDAPDDGIVFFGYRWRG